MAEKPKMKDVEMSMLQVRYRVLLRLPILNLAELEELGMLMERLDPARYEREIREAAYG